MCDKLRKRLNVNKHLLVNLLLHLLAVLLFILPEIITNIDDNRPVPNGVIIRTVLFLSIFYINYFLIDNFLDRKGGKWRFAGVNSILLIVASCIVLLTSHGYSDKSFHPVEKPPHPHHEHFEPHKHISSDGNAFEHSHPPRHEPQDDAPKSKIIHAAGRLSRDLLIAVLVIALACAVRVTARWLKDQQKQAELIVSQRETELENLKGQINPHFLFNTLNTIYALIAIDPANAQKAVHELSGMMRYALYDSSVNVTLQQEINFLKNYIELMKMRMNPKRRIETSLTCNGYCDQNIAPLLFIPIIENAFKYGNTADVTNPIKMEISVNDGIARCYTFNHFDPQATKAGNDSGIGLTNLQRRLSLIYGKNATFKTIEQNNTFQVELTINLNNYNNLKKQ